MNKSKEITAYRFERIVKRPNGIASRFGDNGELLDWHGGTEAEIDAYFDGLGFTKIAGQAGRANLLNRYTRTTEGATCIWGVSFA